MLIICVLRVCFLGVLALVISWGSLGLELAVSSVSVSMATLLHTEAGQYCSDACSSWDLTTYAQIITVELHKAASNGSFLWLAAYLA